MAAQMVDPWELGNAVLKLCGIDGTSRKITGFTLRVSSHNTPTIEITESLDGQNPGEVTQQFEIVPMGEAKWMSSIPPLSLTIDTTKFRDALKRAHLKSAERIATIREWPSAEDTVPKPAMCGRLVFDRDHAANICEICGHKFNDHGKLPPDSPSDYWHVEHQFHEIAPGVGVAVPEIVMHTEGTTDCADCSGSGNYQPLTGPPEKCKTCGGSGRKAT